MNLPSLVSAKKTLFGCLFALCCLATNPLSACDDCPTVDLGFRGDYCADGAFTITLTGESTATSQGDGDGCDYFTKSPKEFAKLKPFKTYTLSTSGGGISTVHIDFDVPEGYTLYVGGEASEAIDDISDLGCDSYSGSWQVELRGCGGSGGAPGEGGGPAISSVVWSVGLGALPDGRSAGAIQLREGAITAALHDPAALYYSPPSPLIDVVTSGSVLRQIKAPQTFADIVIVSPYAYEIRFYDPSQVGALSGGLYSLNGSPFKVWTLDNPDGGSAANRLRFKEDDGDHERTSIVTHDPSDQKWTLEKGNGAYLKTRERTGDEVTITVSDSGGVRSKVVETYATFPWGEEMIVRVDDPDGDALITTWEYYTDPADAHSYRKIKHVVYPDGNWEKYDYETARESLGMLKTVYRPWLDAPAEPSQATANSGRVTTYSYGWTPGSYFYKTLQSQTEKINGVTVAYRYESLSATSHNGEPARSLTSERYNKSGTYLTTVSKRYASDAAPHLAGKPYRIERPDGKLTTYSYEKGTYDPVAHTFLPGSGEAIRTITTHGTVSSPDGIADRTYRTLAITDERGVRATETTELYTGSAYEPLSETRYFHNPDGSLDRIEKDGRIVREQSWQDGHLLSETDALGITTSYSNFDSLDRPLTTSRAGVATTVTLDALGRERAATITGGSLTLNRSADYDLAGRLISRTDENGLTRQTAHSSDGRITTVTGPDGSTTITESHLDGQIKSVTGTGVVHTFHSYGVESNGFRTHTVHTASETSPRWEKRLTDWAGRLVKTTAPGYLGDIVTTNHYNSQGQLWKTSTPGMAATVREFDDLGEVRRSGLDVSGSDSLLPASDDRFTEIHSTHVFEEGAWFDVRETITYPGSGDTTPATLSITKDQISDLAVDELSRSIHINEHNSATTTVKTVDRLTATVTRTTDFDWAENPSVQVTVNGRISSTTTPAVQTQTIFEYDDLGRLHTIGDPRTSGIARTTTYHPGTNQIASVATPAGTTTYEYGASGGPGAGQPVLITALGDLQTRHEYTGRGEIHRTWGSGTYPVEFTYDAYGQRTGMRTYRDSEIDFTEDTWPGGAGSSGDLTQWHHHPASGLLESKEDALGESTTYTYDTRNLLHTRTWARNGSGETPLVTTYGFNTTGNLTSVSYSDATPAVTITPDRLGRPAEITDGSGTRTVTHSLGGELLAESHTAGPLAGLTSSRSLDDHGRIYGMGIDGQTAHTYHYSGSDGRLEEVRAGDLIITHLPLANSDFVEHLEFENDGTPRMIITRAYDSANRLDGITNELPGGPVFSSHDYTYDAAGRRSIADLADNTRWNYGYNDRGEVTSAIHESEESEPIPGREFAFAFDPIGNRTAATTNGRQASYTPNAVNQYASRTIPPFIDITGVAHPEATVTVNNQPTERDTAGRFHQALGADNSADAAFPDIRIVGVRNDAGPTGEDVVTTAEGRHFLAKDPETFVHDKDGNLLEDGRWTYEWDGENRLAAMETRTGLPAALPRKRLEFAYDGQSRRAQKKVLAWDDGAGAFVPESTTRYFWSGWTLLGEYDETLQPLRTHLWGHDLSGSFEGAGGVGGLLATTVVGPAGGTWLMAYDGNGNIMAAVNAETGEPEAQFEYGPFGETLQATGPVAGNLPFRFSTKYEDSETGLLYYGYRFYSPGTGRWASRDPIEERGGLNLYAFVGNDGVNRWDLLGLDWIGKKIRNIYISRMSSGPLGLLTNRLFSKRIITDTTDVMRTKYRSSMREFYRNYLKDATISMSIGYLKKINLNNVDAKRKANFNRGGSILDNDVRGWLGGPRDVFANGWVELCKVRSNRVYVLKREVDFKWIDRIDAHSYRQMSDLGEDFLPTVLEGTTDLLEKIRGAAFDIEVNWSDSGRNHSDPSYITFF